MVRQPWDAAFEWMRRLNLMKTRPGKRHQRGHGISVVVPFRPDNDIRERTWEWLREYYTHHLPGIEIIMGTDDGFDPFSKSMAVNDGCRRATGEVFVIMDADCLIDPDVIVECAQNIRDAERRDHRRWYVPYRRFYRLSAEFSEELLESNPRRHVHLEDPPPSWELDVWTGTSSGHHWGALITIMPRRAFELVRGMDPRFRSWGSEDVSFLWALDTLYCRHRTTDNPVYHLWHPRFGGDTHVTRFWKGGTAGQNNDLAMKYRAALHDPVRMGRLVDEGFSDDSPD